MTLLFAVLVAAAAVSALVGQGGGVFFTPLQLWMGVPFQQAAATSLILIVGVSLSSALVFRNAGRIDWRLVLAVEPATMLGGFAGGLVSHVVPAPALEATLGGVLVLLAPLVLRAPRRSPAPGGRRRVRRVLVLPLMAAVGALTAALGIGGGVLKVSVMLLVLGAAPETAIASSAVMVGLTAAAGLAGHASVGHVAWRSAGPLAAGAFAGAQLGSRASLRLRTEHLRRVLGGVQLAVGALVLAQALR